MIKRVVLKIWKRSHIWWGAKHSDLRIILFQGCLLLLIPVSCSPNSGFRREVPALRLVTLLDKKKRKEKNDVISSQGGLVNAN